MELSLCICGDDDTSPFPRPGDVPSNVAQRRGGWFIHSGPNSRGTVLRRCEPPWSVAWHQCATKNRIQHFLCQALNARRVRQVEAVTPCQVRRRLGNEKRSRRRGESFWTWRLPAPVSIRVRRLCGHRKQTFLESRDWSRGAGPR